MTTKGSKISSLTKMQTYLISSLLILSSAITSSSVHSDKILISLSSPLAVVQDLLVIKYLPAIIAKTSTVKCIAKHL